MKAVLTAQQMREAEQKYFDQLHKSIDLMETAAQELTRAVISVMPKDGKTCVFACGTGGNGGDGYAAARLFARRGGRAIIVELSQPKNSDAIENRRIVYKHVYACISINDLDKLPRPDVWADCIFGTGCDRAPEGDALKLIRRINEDRKNGSKVVACDLPSGLNADNGNIPGECVNADVTVSLQTYKAGQLIGMGPLVCGELRVRDIGLPEEIMPGDSIRFVEDTDVEAVLPERRRNAHKNDFGHLLIVAGSRGMAGAAVICAKAALRSGVGLITVACPESITDIIQISVPCAMCLPLPENNGVLADEAAPILKKNLEGKSAVAIGPGLSSKASVKCIKVIMESGIKTVMDADALNILSAHTELYSLFHSNLALTPHPGEASRLTGEKNVSQMQYAESLSSMGWPVLIKGVTSVIMGKSTYFSSTGCVGMAKGGSGDALTGMVGALLAQGLDTETALWAASQLHGRAGEKAQERFGNASMLPTDLIECIPEIYPQ